MVVWGLAAVAAVFVVAIGLGDLRSTGLPVPKGGDSQRAGRLIADRMPQLGEEQAVLAFSSQRLRGGDAAYDRAMVAAAQAAARVRGAGQVLALPQVPGQDPHHAYLLVALKGDTAARLGGLPVLREAVHQAVATASEGRVTVAVTGQTPLAEELVTSDLRDVRVVEAVTVPVALMLLVYGLGSVGAALLVLFTAGLGVLVSAGMVAGLGLMMPVDTPALVVAMTMGFGLGLDYALLILIRYRQARAEGLGPQTAAEQATATAGRAVLWCAGAVVVTGAALLTVPVELLRTVAVAAGLATVVAAGVATTLLPLLLPRLDRLLSAGRVRRPGDAREIWERWARHLMRRPWPYLGSAAVLLVLAALPMAGMRLGVDVDRASLTGSEVGAGLAQTERDGLANVTLLALPHAAGQDPVDTTDLITALADDPRITTAVALDNGRDLTVVAVADRIPVDSPAAGQLLDDERRLGQSTLTQGQKILAGGGSAALTDLQRAMRSALTQVAILVLAGAFLLMLVVFRSLVLPVKAIAMNLLATGAACGLLSWFTGHTVNVLVPLMALTLVFGLSLDYEVFLVHRITEHYRAGASCQEAVVRGLSSTAQPITLAATTMSVVFAGLLVTGRQELRQVGFLVAVAVLLDATVIRLLVVPALMRLLGHRNWWLPSPLARLWPPLPVLHTTPQVPGQVPGPNKAADSYTTTAWSHSEERPS
ncbi:MMPL family transporter [Streptomyces katrae]|uniref:MMPL family transporter n=1 Tax=Streptomyces katrae TaxID=68223 RepID=UPI0004BE9698|nr:MMPL family transporter [Streptomyces katrae]